MCRSLLTALVVLGSIVACSDSDAPLPGGPPAPEPSILEFSANPEEIDHGQETVLSWRTEGITQIRIESEGELLLESTEPLGNLPVAPAKSTTYRLEASSSEGALESAVSVGVRPVIFELAADAAPDAVVGDLVSLRWTTGGAQSLSLSDGEDFNYQVPASELLQGTVDAPIPENGLFTLIAQSGDLETTKTVSVIPLPTIVSFQAFPTRVGAGESYEVSWETTGAAYVELERDGELLPVDRASGSLVETTLTETHYRLRAFNSLGEPAEPFEEASLQISVGSPLIVAFTTERRNVAAGAEITFSWTVDGGVSLLLQEPSGSGLQGCSTTEPARIQAGSCVVEAPTELGSYTYELLVTNALDEVSSATQTIQVVDGPTIDRFEVEPKELELGDSLTISWETGTDADGEAPSLVLTDDRGSGPYDLGDKDPAADSFTFSPTSEGAYLFTLEATTAGKPPALASRSVRVWGIPTVDLVADPPSFDPLEIHTVSLLWTSTEAASLTLWELDPEGEPIEPPLFSTTDPAKASEGAIDVSPSRSTRYLAVVTNGVGTKREMEVSVDELLPTITSFAATPAEVIEGGLTELSWTTERATHVTLDFDPGYTFEDAPLPFIDLLESRDSVQIPHEKDSCDGRGTPDEIACPVFDFPDGFTFSFGDRTYDSAKLFVDGFLSFDHKPDNSAAPTSDKFARLPTGRDAKWTNLLAPYWSDLNFANDEHAGFYYELRKDEKRGRYLIIQWARTGLYFDEKFGGCKAILDMNLILWKDGGFDYRYRMPEAEDEKCNGVGASIGYQFADGAEGRQISFDEALAGGLSAHAFSFTPFNPGINGSVQLSVPVTRRFTLTASDEHGRSTSQTIEVRTHPHPSIASLRVEPLEPLVGQDTIIAWSTSDVVSIRVVGAGGNVLCEGGADALPNGACQLKEARSGVYEYTVVGIGVLGTEVAEQISIEFWEPLEITSFTATPDSIDYDAPLPITLGWSSAGASHARLLANGEDITELLGAQGPDAGSITVRPSVTTTYRLEISDDRGRLRVAERQVEVRTFDPFKIDSSHRMTNGDETVTLSWSTSVNHPGRAFVSFEPQMFEMIEVEDAPFIDISRDGDPVPGFLQTDGLGNAPASIQVDFPDGFTFPYFGVEETRVSILTNGFVRFEERTYPNAHPSRHLLEFSYESDRMGIAVFWDFLRSWGVGNAFTQFLINTEDPEKDQFVIQWDRMQFGRQGLKEMPDPLDDLTFQLGLFRDGSFEIRYGTMVSTTNPNRAGASQAVVGYRKPGPFGDPPHPGFELFHWLANPVNLNGRSFRAPARGPSGSVDLRPSKTTEYRLCIELGGFEECETALVVVPARGDLIITELNLVPEEGSTAQWFEVRNLSRYPIDLRGMTIKSNSGEHRIESDVPVVVAAGRFLTLGAGAGTKPDYVYGAALALGTAVDDLQILFGGREVASLSWDTTWQIPAARTLSLDPAFHLQAAAGNQLPAHWCEGSAAGSPGAAYGCHSEHYDFDPLSDAPFLDISETGAVLSELSRQNSTSLIPGGLGFTIPFFGEPIGSVWASKNGFLGVGTPIDPMAQVSQLPAPGAHIGMIAPLWNFFSSAGDVRYETKVIDGRKVLIIQWSRMIRPSSTGTLSSPGSTTFQAQIWENGDIVLAYGPMSGNSLSTPLDPTPLREHFGGTGSAGIQSIGGKEWIQFFYMEPILWEGRSVAFRNKD